MQVLLAVNQFYIFPATTLMRLKEAALLYPPDRRLQKNCQAVLHVQFLTAQKTLMRI